VFILVLLLVSFITVMFHLGYLISLTHVYFIAFLSLYIVLIDVLIYSAAQLQECLINLLTYIFAACNCINVFSAQLHKLTFLITITFNPSGELLFAYLNVCCSKERELSAV